MANTFRADRVVFVTFDGVRRDEFFQGTKHGVTEAPLLLPFFWNNLASKSLLFGTHLQTDPMHASHPSLISLPCYQTIMTGRVQPGENNDLDNVGEETIFDRVNQDMSGHGGAAVYASWSKIDRAISHTYGSIQASTGPSPDTKDLPPWPECRWDKHTFALAIEYLVTHDPKILYISLTDTDDVSHTKDFAGYLAAIRQSDQFLAELVSTIASKCPGTTLLFVTTDHGRGLGESWHDHHAGLPHAKEIWAFATGFGVALHRETGKTSITSHLDIRPTLEAALGLAPRTGQDRGTSLLRLQMQ